VSTALQSAELGIVAIVPAQNFKALRFLSAPFPLDTLRTATWTVLVRVSADAAAVTRASAMGALRVTADNGCLDISIRTLTVTPAPDDGNGGRLFELGAGMEIRNKDYQGFLHFEVAETLADDLGNSLASPWAVVLNKE
jgi:hypothetical protein